MPSPTVGTHRFGAWWWMIWSYRALRLLLRDAEDLDLACRFTFFATGGKSALPEPPRFIPPQDGAPGKLGAQQFHENRERGVPGRMALGIQTLGASRASTVGYPTKMVPQRSFRQSAKSLGSGLNPHAHNSSGNRTPPKFRPAIQIPGHKSGANLKHRRCEACPVTTSGNLSNAKPRK